MIYKFYRLYSDVDNKVYVGSTIQALNIKYQEHRRRALVNPHRRFNQHFNQIGWHVVSIELICEEECTDNWHMRFKLFNLIHKMKAELNIPSDVELLTHN